ncbi:uncharacterized protein LOC101455341 [Ceratitis capitata]|uniref:(Mediterranean fruit fly) hypothetical protein n=1 Tax=Ceratitis capitata TaxID=7213 RepID=A0A811VEF6_CERCA|nr:uncharacterized protein LOC101455341 [Ceratitis capitata]XP_020714730.1 uncharacterized protein LOC101455341 [Ceratitis capitata]CAD7014265.1 unnamed protein product [Ceratitis capitata]
MNTTREDVYNLLFSPNTQDYDEEMYINLLQFASSGKIVVVLTQSASAPKLLPLVNKLGIHMFGNKQSLQRLIFMNCDNVATAIQKLLDLHKWRIRPNIIVLDLYAFAYLKDHPTRFPHGVSQAPLLKGYVQCIAVLLNMMNILKNEDAPNQHTSISKPIFSIVVLQKIVGLLTEQQVEVVVDLYYDSKIYREFKTISDFINLLSSENSTK